MRLSPVIVTESDLNALEDRLKRAPGTLFAILDSCDEPRVPPKVAELGGRAVSLYSGSGEEDYWAIAPYLLQLDSITLRWIVDQLWETPWGVLLAASKPLSDLRRHFRRFLLVKSPDGNQYVFRFYDPRLLRCFLDACTPAERDDFFGPVESFYVKGENSEVDAIMPNIP